MTQTLKKVCEVDPNDSEAVKDAVNNFFQKASKVGDADPIRWLRTLVDVVNRFPKYCMSHRNTIENLLICAIDSNDYYYVIEAAKCSQAVQQVRPSQEKTATPKTSWQEQMSLLCNAAHSLVTAIFPNAVEMYNSTRNDKKKDSSLPSALTTTLLKISSYSDDQNKGGKKSLLQTRLRNIFCFIQAMLVEVYPVAKPVRPQIVLDVIVRALSVSSGSKNMGVDVAAVKIEALRTLDALVACLGPNLIPFSPLVFRLLMQTFRWSSENTDTDCRKVRCCAYSSLGSWLITLHCHRSAADSRTPWEEELTDHILRDTAPAEKVVQFTMGPQPTKKMSKKAKRKLANANLLESSIASHMPGEKNKISIPEECNNEVLMAALLCAETFLLVCGRFLKPTTHKLLQERALRECYNTRRYSEEALTLLLRVAEASRKTAPSGVAPPTQHCLQLYSTLVNSTHGEISKFCTQALLDIRLHLHCSPPSLKFALEAPPEEQPSTIKRKKMSEKNKAALESLLGPDRMLVSSNEEVLTVADEPLSKKQRLYEDKDIDRISISSDSISSIVVTDGSNSDVEETTVAEKDNDIAGVKEKSPADVEVVAEEKSNENNDIDVVDNNTDQAIEPNIFNSPNTKKVFSNPETEKDSNNTESVESKTVEEKAKNTEIVVDEDKFSIHETPTQMPLNVSTEIIDGDEGPLSLEVAYDYPNTGNATVNLLNKVDDEMLPSTYEADDIMITCGQVVNSSQEVYLENKSDDTEASQVEVNDVLRINSSPSDKDDIVENGGNISVDIVKEMPETDESKITPKNGVSIEDMMADFVNEVNEDITVA